MTQREHKTSIFPFNDLLPGLYEKAKENNEKARFLEQGEFISRWVAYQNKDTTRFWKGLISETIP